LPAQADAPGLPAVGEHDGRAQGGEVLGRALPDLLLGVAMREGLAVDAVLLGDLIGPAEAEDERADAAATGVGQRLVGGAGHVQRWVRVLQWLRVDRSRRDVDVPAVVLDDVLDPEAGDEPHSLVDDRPELLELVAERARLLPGATLPEADVEPTAAEDVERG